MTTETTDPLLEAVMEAADYLALARALIFADADVIPTARERLRLHLQLALAKARYLSVLEAREACWESVDCQPCPKVEDAVIAAKEQWAALEARLQEAQ